MNELIYFETFAEGWRLARLANPYTVHLASSAFAPSPKVYAAHAIVKEVEYRTEVRDFLWDSGELVYGLS